MCGRFAQFHSRDEFLAALAPDTPVSTAGDWHARYNVASGSDVNPHFLTQGGKLLVDARPESG